MITRIVRLSIQEDKLLAFRSYFDSSYPQIRHFNGCLHLSLYQDTDEKTVLITYSQWESAEHLEAYRNSAVFKSTWAKVKPLFSFPAEAFSMQEITTGIS